MSGEGGDYRGPSTLGKNETLRPQCKGSWLLGSACGHCLRCLAEAPNAFKILDADNKRMKEIIEKFTLGITPYHPAQEYDITDKLKLAQYEYVREVLYGPTKGEDPS